MNRNTDIILNALKRRADDRGYIRTSAAEMAIDTALSRATVQRLLDRLVVDGQIDKRSQSGRTGGLLIRLKTASKPPQQTASKPPQNASQCYAFEQTVSGPSALETETVCSETETAQTASASWRRIGPSLWIAPNGDAVSIRSMTPELRKRLRVDETPEHKPNMDAVRAVRTIIDR
jgi:hypothetical protein